MKDPKPKKSRRESSINEAPSRPDGIRRPSEGGVGNEYRRGPGDAERSPTSKTP